MEALQVATDFLIAELTTIHLEKMTCGLDCLTDVGEAGARDFLRECGCERGQTMWMGGVLTGLMEFALQILLGNLHVPQAHVDFFVPQEPHESGKAHSELEHLGRETVPQSVRCQMGGATGALGSLIQRRSESGHKDISATTTTWQQEALRGGEACGRDRTAQGNDPLHDPPHLGIGWHQAFGVQFAEGNMERPLVASHLP